ncbi:MAG: response regulator transcription factor [candidate division Zixibacteria bacterium]|nr:response regulator transcription factor [candidate division Zixibacteria bacterium]
MRILIAEDDSVSRTILEQNLIKWGYEIIITKDGKEAYQVLTGENPPHFAILDWMMPEMDGVDICREIRKHHNSYFIYIILLTAKGGKDDIVNGLEAGADDYIIKPFNKPELKARVDVGIRMINLELSLENKISELKTALDNVRQLQGIIPICAWCKRIRDDEQYWQSVEGYIVKHSTAEFSHSICPDCRVKMLNEDEIDETKAPLNVPIPEDTPHE